MPESLTLLHAFKCSLLGRLGGSVGKASAFSSGEDPRVLGWSPVSGSLLSVGEGGRGLLLPLLFPLPMLSLCKTNKILKKKKKRKERKEKNDLFSVRPSTPSHLNSLPFMLFPSFVVLRST